MRATDFLLLPVVLFNATPLFLGSMAAPDSGMRGTRRVHRQVRQFDGTVTKLRLINADTNLPIADYDPLIDLTRINVDTLPTTNLTIEAITVGDVGSMMWDFNGIDRIENYPLWALCGNVRLDFNSCKRRLKPGTNATIKVTPFASKNATGARGEPLSIRLTIYSDGAPIKSPTANSTVPTSPRAPVKSPRMNSTSRAPVKTPSQNISAPVAPRAPTANTTVLAPIKSPTANSTIPTSPRAPVKSPRMNSTSCAPVKTPSQNISAPVAPRAPTANTTVLAPIKSPTANSTVPTSPRAPVKSPRMNSTSRASMKTPSQNISAPVAPRAPTANTTLKASVKSPTISKANV